MGAILASIPKGIKIRVLATSAVGGSGNGGGCARSERMGNAWDKEREVTAEQVADAMESIVGIRPSGVSHLASGFENAVFRTETGTLIKVSLCQDGDDGARLERDILPVIAGVLPTAIPCPDLYAEPPASPWPLVRYREVPGTSLLGQPGSFVPSPRFAEQLGRAIKVAHGAEVDRCVSDELRTMPNRAAFSHRIPQCLELMEKTSKSGLSIDTDSLQEQLRVAQQHQDASLPQGFCHGDLHQRHAMVDEHGNLSGIIDWGDMLRGTQAMDLQLHWSAFEGEARDAFAEAYGGLSDAELATAKMVAIFTTLILLAAAIDQGQSRDAARLTTDLARITKN